jgi:hypothetical protein
VLLKTINQKLDRIIAMSETATQAITDLTTMEAKQASDLAKLKTDVATFIANVAAEPLTPTQQAAVNALKNAMATDDINITQIDATAQPAA